MAAKKKTARAPKRAAHRRAPPKKAPVRRKAPVPAGSRSEVLVATLQKKYAKTFGSSITTIVEEQQAAAQLKEFIPTGLDVLDNYVIGRGGFPVGRMSEVFGPEACIAGNSIVKFSVVDTETGKRVNHKGGSVQLLYERFHNVKNTRGAPRADRSRLKFLAPSVNDEGRVVSNEILDVVYTGVKQVFRVVVGRQSLVATSDHKFLTPTGYVELGNLVVGDSVMLHDNTPFTSAAQARLGVRREVHFKHHPHGSKHEVNGYTYYRIRRARALYEAAMNGLSFPEFADRLNKGKLKGLKFLDPSVHVHHKDEDYTNDSLDNLDAVDGAEHSRLHAIENHNNLRFCVQPHVISKIELAGTTGTYDLKMAAPYHNYVANKFVVHNCGKTALTYRSLGAAQAIGGTAVLLDAEYSFDEERAETHGVNIKDLVLCQPRHLEEAIDMIKAIVKANGSTSGPMLVGLDSIASLNTKAGLSLEAGDKGVAAEARIFSDELRDLPRLLTENRTHLCMINQIRHIIGASKFASNITTPGGNGPRFYSSVRLQFFGGKAIKNSNDEHIGKVVTVVAVKNRLSAPFKKARIRFDYANGYNNQWTTIEHAKRLKVVRHTPEKPVTYVKALEKLDWDFNAAGMLGREAGNDDSTEADDDDE